MPRRVLARSRSPLLIALTVLVALLLAAAAATAVLLITEGSPLPAPHAADIAPWEHPVAGSVRLAGLDAPDPEGGPAWDIRIFQSGAGETCTAVGQVFNGKFGIVGLDRVFRALPLTGVDACGVPGIAGPVLAGARQFAGRTLGEARTVVNGVAGAGAKSVTAYGPEGARRLTLGVDGSFVTVYRGLLGEVRPRIVVVTGGGHAQTIAFAASAAFETPDPDGGAAWSASGGSGIGVPGSSADEDCAQVSHENGPGSGGGQFNDALTPQICGQVGRQPLFALFRRFDPGSDEETGTPWGSNPSRTLVYGGTSLRVHALTLLGAGGPRPLPIDPRDGVFLAVLDGHVDPRGLTLIATLTDGRTVRYRHSTSLIDGQTGKPIREGPVEPYRAFPHPGLNLPPLEDPIVASVRDTQQAADPAGGPAWRLRSWQGRVDPRAKFGATAHPERFYCWQTGVPQAGGLVQPNPGGTAIALKVSDEARSEDTAQCMSAVGPTVETLTPTNDSYPKDAGEYSPVPVRTVVSGVVEPPATHAVLLGAGAPRAIATDANHSYLMVLEGRYWTAALRVRAYLPDGKTVTSSTESSGPQLQPQVRAPSPDGSAPWGFTRTSLCPSAWSISEIGRVVEGRFATVENNGQVGPGGGGSSTGSPCGTRNARLQERDEPLGGTNAFDDVIGFQIVHNQPERTEPPTEAEVQRRTLPGATVIAGTAAPDVKSITLSTPADVRTVQPVGPSHVFIVVYDGDFYRGTFTATALLSDGRTVTQPIRGASSNIDAEPESHRRSLAAQLRSDRRTLGTMSAQLAAVLHAGPARRRELLNGVPLSQLMRGVREIRAIVAGERARIAYIHAHPGILPPE
jgi:hypothetical protein